VPWADLPYGRAPVARPRSDRPFLLLFIEAISDLANPLVLGGDYTVLASRAYLAVIGESDTTSAAVYCVILLVPSIGLFVVQRYWLGRTVRTTVTGNPSGSVHLVTGWTRWPIFGVAGLIGALIVSVYATVLLGAVTKVFGVNNTLTPEHFREVLFGTGRIAIVDTAMLAAIATPLAIVLSYVIRTVPGGQRTAMAALAQVHLPWRKRPPTSAGVPRRPSAGSSSR
jgi:iron(III) transport system permease protein